MPTALPRVLVIDDDAAVRRVLGAQLRRMGCEVVEATDGVDGMGKLHGGGLALVITDLRMPRADGFAVLEAIRSQRLGTPAIMLTGEGSVADCVLAMRAGATNFLSKPFNGVELERVVRAALLEGAADEAPGDRAESASGRPEVALIGDSPQVRALLTLVEQVARTDATVLLTGETGTGKEVVARLLHCVSERATRPFVAVNCGAFPEALVESELFGHARGSFTGATGAHVGRFVQAHGGTLFLDEVGDLPLSVQVKLLRAIQEREVTPVGEARPQAVDIRLVAATHRDLSVMREAGTFREDLYYRLAVVTIEIPPLRDRPEDIVPLSAYFLDAAARRAGKTLTLAPATLERLCEHRWPGNVRELENLIERLVILNRTGVISPAELTPAVLARPGRTVAERPITAESGGGLVKTLGVLEDRLIEEALRKAGGNKTQAARLLGLNRTTLVEKLKRMTRVS